MIEPSKVISFKFVVLLSQLGLKSFVCEQNEYENSGGVLFSSFLVTLLCVLQWCEEDEDSLGCTN